MESRGQKKQKLTKKADQRAKPFGNKRRQELETYYRMNGAIYLVKTEHFLRTGSLYGDGCYAYIMSAERSVDIDNPTDFLFAECLLNARSE